LLQFQDYAKEKNAVVKDKLKSQFRKPFFFRYGNLKGLMESFKKKNDDKEETDKKENK